MKYKFIETNFEKYKKSLLNVKSNKKSETKKTSEEFDKIINGK